MPKRVLDLTDERGQRWTDPQLAEQLARQERMQRQAEYVKGSTNLGMNLLKVGAIPAAIAGNVGASTLGIPGRLVETGGPGNVGRGFHEAFMDKEAGFDWSAKDAAKGIETAGDVLGLQMGGGILTGTGGGSGLRAGVGRIPAKGLPTSKVAAPPIVKERGLLEGPGPGHPSYEKAVADTARKNAMVESYVPPQWPKGYEKFDVPPTGYDLTWDDKTGKYFAGKRESEAEQALKKDLAKAETKVKKGELPPLFTSADIFDQPFRPKELDLPKWGPKGTPDYITEQLPRARDLSIAAYEKGKAGGGELSGTFYKMGRLYEDLVKTGGREYADKFMDDYGQMMGATTAFSKPLQNQRAATFHQMRMMQGLPVAEAVPYPFGHMYHTGTHLPGIKQINETGALDPGTRPKGANFAGALAGTRKNTVIDQVESAGMNIQNKKNFELGNKTFEADPPGQSYTDFMNMRDKLAKDYNLSPEEFQAFTWAGFQKPEDVAAYAKPHMFNIGDRVNVTSALVGRDPKDVYQDLLRGTSTFTHPVAGATAGAAGPFQGTWGSQPPAGGEQPPAAPPVDMLDPEKMRLMFGGPR